MNAAESMELVPVEEYLAAELTSPQKHEYLGGGVYALCGARNAHNQIATNALIALGSQLRGQRCRAFNSDTKIRIRLPHHLRFYYPDLSVVCRPNPLDESFQDEPVVLVEVLSRSTRRLDEGEKKEAYLAIPSLCVLLLVEQERSSVQVFRRTDQGFVREVFHGMQSVVPLPEVGAELALADLYEGLDLTPET